MSERNDDQRPDFKRLVRARAEATGESYVTARARLRARRPREHETPDWRDAQAGVRMTPQEAAALEARVAADEDDVVSRAQLLGFYQRRRDSEVSARRAQHALWFIANSPRSWLAGSNFCELHSEPWHSVGRALWLALIEDQPDDPALLSNAASWLLLRDQELAIALGERLVDLYPTDVQARLSLAHAHTLGERRSPETAARALEVLGEPPRAEAGVRVWSLLDWLQKAAWTALYAHHDATAEQYATELLDKARDDRRNDGDAVHHGNLVLGHIALRRDDVETAERHLAAAGNTRGSAPLNSFGPNTSLATALLRRGRSDAVVSFLDDCRLFWAPSERADDLAVRHRETLDRWMAVIEAGGVPDFGGNEVYGS